MSAEIYFCNQRITLSSPTRRVTRSRSRYSKRGIAYLRLTPVISLKRATSIFGELLLRAAILWRRSMSALWWKTRSSEILIRTLSRKSRVTIFWARILSTFSPANTSFSDGTFNPAEAKTDVLQAVREFHDANPLVAGMSKEELRDRVNLGPEVFYSVLAKLTEDNKLEVAGELAHMPGRGVVMKDEEAESKKIIEQAFASAGLKVPSLKEVLAGLKVDKIRSQKIVTLLLRDKVLIKISEELVFHQSALMDLRHKIAALKNSAPKMDVARFKDMTGVSRKYAIPLLEYLDRERVTRRVGDERMIL